ncbi:MAG: UDP-N-acetylmuramate dehydrogenase [Planctomycetota bacterium]|nr:UDP-N-acetylmuramate dehydrogenase [Planctomycetota bacterium]
MYSVTLIPREEVLSEWTTMRIGGVTEHFYEPLSPEDVCLLLAHFRSEGVKPFVLGGGSKVVIKDGVFTRPVISMRSLCNVKFDGETVFAAAGVMLPNLIKMCVERGLGGIEVLCGIPATVGGAVVMNAGTKCGSFGDFVSAVEFANGDKLFTKRRDELVFSYRRGPVQGGEVVVGVWLNLKTSSPQTLMERMHKILKERVTTQPMNKPSAGCVFKNPSPHHSAGYLIERVGLKGYRVGGAQFSSKHANFIINTGNATFKDVLELIETARKRVKKVFGVELQTEMRLIS